MPECIGRYQIHELVGQGGFGAVYRATDESLDREVAIKVPRRTHSSTVDYQRWISEARMVAMLEHPHIVPVFDVGSSDEVPFYVVSKYVEGSDLRVLMQREKPAVAQAVQWVADTADALQHAHTQGLVHRDVKPSNLLIDARQHAWLTDFGLALREDDIGRDADQKRLVGTFCYMSPEQARGEGHLVDGRADVFALGIILYELLCGSRPFKGKSSEQLLRNIVRAEPRPLRQWDPRLSTDLERICMKALAQRRGDRYDSAHDMADDLRRYAQAGREPESSDQTFAGPAGSGRVSTEGRVVPKGLRAFDEHDRDFFLKLVPGPRDRRGVPELLRALKRRIEANSLEESFRVGLLYGSSGSGKSSLVRAGLIPLLDPAVQVAYIEADPHQTETRLLAAVGPLVRDETPPDNLVSALSAIRQRGVAGGKKVLIVLDQFEQWLHAHRDITGRDLVNALRHCDGKQLQCLLLIRDDFWMPATRFFHELEIRLVQDVNSRAVDRFETRHARFVLAEFGRAYGCLPEDPSQTTDEQDQFLDAVIESVQEDGKVISVQLVVLSQMLKGHPWTLKTLSEFGGTAGVDINFLDATFTDPVAAPHHRALQGPARRVLAALLPEAGTDIKGRMQEVAHLQRLSGLAPTEFQALLGVLDGELRMITPTVNVEEGEADCYQLTHDFLVPPLREWLTRNQRQTARGRTQLRLRELSQYWRVKQESRFLPNALEFLRILLLTRAADRDAEESRLFAAAARYHGKVLGGILVIACIVGLATFLVGRRLQESATQQRAESGVNQLLAADLEHAPGVLQSLNPLLPQATPLLVKALDDPQWSPSQKRLARIALVAEDDKHVQPLVDSFLTANPAEIRLICDNLQPYQDQAIASLQKIVASDDVDEQQWLAAAYSLAQLEPGAAVWPDLADRLTLAVINQRTPDVIEMAGGFRPLAAHLVGPTRRHFSESEVEEVRLNAAVLLSKLISPSDPTLTELLVTATPAQFEVIFPIAAQRPDEIIPQLQRELDAVATPKWPDALPDLADVPASVRHTIESSGGILDQSFAYCQSLPDASFDEMAATLQLHGYRPICVRPYLREEERAVAAVWHRDGQPWQLTRHATAEDARDQVSEMRPGGLTPVDVSAVRVGEGVQYTVLWGPMPDDAIDSRMYIGLTEEQHHRDGWGPLNEGGYVPRVNLKFRHPDGQDRYCSVRRKRRIHPAYDDAWNDNQASCESRLLDGWHQVDVRVNAAGDFDFDVSYGAVWWNAGNFESQSLLGMSMDDQVERSTELMRGGYRPVSLSVWEGDGGPVAASVWHRPTVTDGERDRLSSRQAGAAIALLRLGQSETFWPLLDSRPDPRLRSFLISRLSPFGADPQVLADQLMREHDLGRRFALIAALSHYRGEQLPAGQAERLKSQIRQWGVHHPSSGIHSICAYLCRRWGWHEMETEIHAAEHPDPAEGGQSEGDVSWFRGSEDFTMVAITDPVEFRLGSPGDEPFRDHSHEVSMRARIPRPFAIANAEVTLAQYRRYDPLVGFASEYTPDDRCPANSVSWFDAIRYCRWLSEQEDIDDDQMCYPPLDEIKPGFVPFDDMLRRTGYRLPTEAEWEYACRAMTTTSRYYGDSSELLGEYAWTINNASDDAGLRLRPIRGRLPNQFGLFDSLGNVMEWCFDTHTTNNATSEIFTDTFRHQPDDRLRMLRGSSIFYIPTSVRCANREVGNTSYHTPYYGFRIARTLSADEVAPPQLADHDGGRPNATAGN